MGTTIGTVAPQTTFKITVQFVKPAATGESKPLSKNDDLYKAFVRAVSNAVGAYRDDVIPVWSEDSVTGSPDLVGGGHITLKAPPSGTSVPPIDGETARNLVLGINRVLRGIRVRRDGSSTGVAALVTDNNGVRVDRQKLDPTLLDFTVGAPTPPDNKAVRPKQRGS